MKARHNLPAVAVFSFFSLCLGLCVASASAQQQARLPEIVISQRMADSLSLTKVAPEYPDAVKSREIAGQIVIAFTIGKDGSVSDVRQQDSGFFGCRSRNGYDPVLQQAAIAAVKQWTFRPFLLHQQPGDTGEPVEVGTAVALPFDFRKPTGAAAPGAPADLASCNPREGDTAATEFIQPKVDPSRPVFGAPVIEASRAEEMLVHKVEATYPQMARIAHIQGNVILHVLIDKQGHVSKMKAMQGHPLFIQPARDAVKQWEYQPFLLNGEPAEVETAVEVKFRM
jgi:TonB family protein